ncbi:hypothetical protein [Catellatospora sp. NPDC049609]|uniref:hypothetical protein n=1 Tax=Catellatospora sp. NPDC049609 TaxID=3155505 RepID=UPI00343A5809
MSTSWATLDPWEKAAKWAKVAPELADDVVHMAKVYAEHQMRQEREEANHRFQLERDSADHRAFMDKRLWYTHVFSVALNGISLALLAVIAAKFGKDATIPALTVLGAGGGLTAVSYGVSSSFRKSWQSSQGSSASATTPAP